MTEENINPIKQLRLAVSAHANFSNPDIREGVFKLFNEVESDLSDLDSDYGYEPSGRTEKAVQRLVDAMDVKEEIEDEIVEKVAAEEDELDDEEEEEETE